MPSAWFLPLLVGGVLQAALAICRHRLAVQAVQLAAQMCHIFVEPREVEGASLFQLRLLLESLDTIASRMAIRCS